MIKVKYLKLSIIYENFDIFKVNLGHLIISYTLKLHQNFI